MGAAPAAVDDGLLAAGGVRFTGSGETARISLDRPRVHNAQLPITWEALRHIGSRLPDQVRVVIVDGIGPSSPRDSTGRRSNRRRTGCWPGWRR